MIRVFSISLGCPKNRVDTEHALGGLGPLRLVDTPARADCVFINTCGFIAPAVQESVRAILETVEDIRNLPPEKRPLVAVAGCLVSRYGAETLAPELPEVDLLLDNASQSSWSARIREALAIRKPGSQKRGGRQKAAPEPPSPARLLSTGPSYAWLKISDGCAHCCSFCTIPGIRGALRSAPADLLEAEARLLLDQGVKEIILVAQDTTSWGRDLGEEHGLRTLLERLLPLPGLARLRLMYLYPAGLTRELLHFLRQAGPPFVPYFDVPVQHASPDVLARMGRPFARNPREVIERIREVFPEAALRTSIITGFPGETEEDVELLQRFLREARFHHLGVFAYQAEEGTPAAAMPNQIPEREKSWRRDLLMELQGSISEGILAASVGQWMDVLVDAPHPEWPGLHTGRVWFQAPESDGITYVSGPGTVPGSLVRAEISEASTYDLTALADNSGDTLESL